MNRYWALLLCFVVSLTAPALEAKPSTASPAPRLIVLAPHLVELLFSIGAGAQIIATSEHADYPEEAKSIPRVGNYAGVQLEKIVALRPDIILVWQSGIAVADVTRLQQLGFRVESFEPKQLVDVATDLRRLGELSGHQAQANHQAQQYLQTLSALQQQYSMRTPVRVFYELWHSPLSSIGNQAWPAQHLQLCGAENVLANSPTAYPQLSIEQVFTLDPQLIIQPISVNEPRSLVNWQTYPQLRASKYQQIIQPNSDLLHRASLRSLAATTTLCEQIEQSRQFYKKQAEVAGKTAYTALK